MQTQKKVVEPKLGNSGNAVIPVAVGSEVIVDDLDEKLRILGELIRKNIQQSDQIRRNLRELLDDGVPEKLGLKETQLLKEVPISDEQRKSAYRWLRAEIISKVLRVPPTELNEFHARKLAKLKDDGLIEKAYELAQRIAALDKCNGTHIDEAIAKVRAALPANNDDDEVQKERDEESPMSNAGIRNKRSQVEKISAEIKEKCEKHEIDLLRELIKCNQTVLSICRKITSKAIDSSDLEELSIYLK